MGPAQSLKKYLIEEHTLNHIGVLNIIQGILPNEGLVEDLGWCGPITGNPYMPLYPRRFMSLPCKGFLCSALRGFMGLIEVSLGAGPAKARGPTWLLG